MRWSSTSERGQVLITTVLLLAVALASVLAISTLALRQVTISSDIKATAGAVTAASAGHEEALYRFWRQGYCLNDGDPNCTGSFSGTLGNGATYDVNYCFLANAASCPNPTSPARRWVRSMGEFGGVRRAFELTF